MSIALSTTEKLSLTIQRIICFVTFSLLYPLAWLWFSCIMRYKVCELKATRRAFKKITKEQCPILICPNHLTFVDSVILMLIFNSYWGYLRHFNTLAWNFPKLEHIKNNWGYRFIIYIGKCIFINFQGSTNDVKSPMRKAEALLAQHNFPMMFPEGTRSFTGRVNTKEFTYGIGQLIRDVPHTKVLCVYLRGHLQKSKSDFPDKGNRFYCRLTCISPYTDAQGLRATRDLASQVIHTLAAMENEYFKTQQAS